MPELHVGATLFEIREAYEAEKTAHIMRCFDIAIEAAGNVQLPLSQETKNRMNGEVLRKTFYAEAENYARGLREEIKEKYLTLDAEMWAAIGARAAIIESELLAPSELNPSDLIAAAQMPEAALLSAIEIADDLDDAGEDTLLLLFKVARENDIDSAIGRVMSLREDISDLMAELAEAQQAPSLNADLAFETFAKDAPSGPEILSARESAVNIASKL